MTVRICEDPRVDQLERHTCRQCRHYDNPESPQCVILACLFDRGEAPGIVEHAKRLQCRGWEPKRTTKTAYTAGQSHLFDDGTDHRCSLCGRQSDHPEPHVGCKERRTRRRILERVALADLTDKPVMWEDDIG